MNELADIISDAITGASCKSIEIRGRFYTVKPPVTIVLARMLKPLSKVCAGETEEISGIIRKRVEQSKHIDEAIAIAVIGDAPMNLRNKLRNMLRKRKILRDLSHLTEAQQKEAFGTVISLIGGKDFFDTARLAMEVTGMMVKQKPSEETR
ncbi:MAG: hypothetical protein LBS55_06505 [Prevotellaceae bacterium]|jgi:hypothetical protein|nr:hypothetical protein [Prevotellaceae bacterium]